MHLPEVLAQGSEYQICRINKTGGNLGDTDIYFVSGIGPDGPTGKNGRAKDSDIKSKAYFCVDFDIRKEYHAKHGKILSHNALDKMYNVVYREMCSQKMIQRGDPWVTTYSGNGYHFYYKIDQRQYERHVYKQAVSYLIEQITGPCSEYIDVSATNLARLFRMPGTYNSKLDSRYGLSPRKCEVLYYNKSCAEFDLFSAYTKKKKRDEKLAVKFKESYSSSGDIDSIPVWEIFCNTTGCSIARDGKNFLSPKDGKFIGALYDQNRNLIVNTGTHYLGSGHKAYGPFTYVKHEVLGTHDPKDVIERFKDNYNIHGNN